VVTHIQFLFKGQDSQFIVFGKISFSVKYETQKHIYTIHNHKNLSIKIL